METIVLLMTLVISIFANDINFYTPSFDCTKVKGKSIEYKICTDEKLSQLDKELSKVYSDFYFISKEIKGDQREWMKQRNKCKDNNCIQQAYKIRIEELNTSLFNQKTFPKTYLDAMKEVQESMDIVWNPLIFSKQEFIYAGLKFKDNLFRFKEITFKLPLISGVSYDDPKLKEILGVCYYYRFDLKIEEYPHLKYVSDGRKYWVNDERKAQGNINVSVWKTTVQDKEWLFIKPTEEIGWTFLVDTALCKQERLKDNLVDALNYNRKQVKRSRLGLYNARIVTYKNNEYVFELSTIQNYRNVFSLLNILGTIEPENPTIEFTGTSQAIVPFQKNR